MKKYITRLLPILLVVVALSSCRNKPDLTAFPNVVYSPKSGDTTSIGVKQIFTANCTTSGCHNSSDGETFSLETYEEVVKGEMVIPGNANGSRLYRCIANRQGPMMPPNGPMTSEAIKSIYIWIEQGAKEN